MFQPVIQLNFLPAMVRCPESLKAVPRLDGTSSFFYTSCEMNKIL